MLSTSFHSFVVVVNAMRSSSVTCYLDLNLFGVGVSNTNIVYQ
jgi:hypothetical protein